MSDDEIAEGMARIQDLDLTEKSKQQLKSSLLYKLAGRNPKLTLDLIGDAISDRKDPLSWEQQYAYSKFVTIDPVAAMAWLDRQIDEGKLVSSALDPIDNPRFRLESALIGQLIETDLATAKTRVAAFNEKERTQLFSNSGEWRRVAARGKNAAGIPDPCPGLLKRRSGDQENCERLGHMEQQRTD